MFGWGTRSWGSKARTEIGGVAGFGKVPALGDFVRSPPRSDEMTAFEEWVVGAMAHGESRRGSAWRADLAQASTLAFLWGGTTSAKGRGLLAGVLRPSHDSVRRAFPVVICAPLPVTMFVGEPHVAPLALADFFREASRGAQNASHARSQAEFQVAVTGVRPPSLAAVAAVGPMYSSFAHTAPARATLGSLFQAEGDAAYAMNTIVDATQPYKGREAPPLSLGVRAPLGARSDTMAAFWIDAVRSSASWSATVPTFFRPLTGSSILVQLGADVPSSVLLDLWAPSPLSDTVCDLQPTAGPTPRFATPLPPRAAEALASPDATLASVLAALR